MTSARGYDHSSRGPVDYAADHTSVLDSHPGHGPDHSIACTMQKDAHHQENIQKIKIL